MLRDHAFFEPYAPASDRDLVGPSRLGAFTVGSVTFGGREQVLMAGPCSVESEEQIERTAALVARCGARVLRGGAFKPSTSPYGFQGLGAEGLRWLRAAADRHGLLVVTEVMDPRKVELVASHAHILQVGARSMQNYDLLKEVGKSGVPVLLKRGLCATYEEWLCAAEYVFLEGNDRILMTERGIRTFETYTRNTLDLAAIAVLKSRTGLPVIVDPSQGTGRRELVPAMSRAALAAGADGLLIEVHPDPEKALKDGRQSLSFEEFENLVESLAAVSEAVGRGLSRSPRSSA